MGNEISRSDATKSYQRPNKIHKIHKIHKIEIPHLELNGISSTSSVTPSVTPLYSFKSQQSSKCAYSICENTTINNGVTGNYISLKIAKLAADFWTNNIDTLSMEEQLEIGCCIFFGMTSSNKDIKKIMKSSIKIESLSLKLVDMFGYLVRCLATNNINLYSSLSALGKLHENIGIKLEHYNPMIISIHDTFSYYFNKQYTVQVKYAMDEVFNVAVKIMNHEYLYYINNHNDDNIDFLESLPVCLKSSVGRGYLFNYLKQKSCAHHVIFLELLSKFKLQMTDKQRFIVARDLIKKCINHDAVNKINISHEVTANILMVMKEYENLFSLQQDFEFKREFFINVENEIYELIMQKYWNEFRSNIKNIKNIKN